MLTEGHERQVSSNANRPVYLRRVIQHLIPNEVKACSEELITEHEVSRPALREHGNQRPRRNAAVVGENNRRDMNIV